MSELPHLLSNETKKDKEKKSNKIRGWRDDSAIKEMTQQSKRAVPTALAENPNLDPCTQSSQQLVTSA